MPTATVEIDELRKIIRDEVRQAFREEFNPKLMELVLRSLPVISDEEQREIEELYGEPSHEVAESFILEHK